jgi:pimeloyl-ACP methyl ester carboxylesterase
MTALGDARAKVAAALVTVGVPVFAQPPGSLQPPCIVLIPGSPWIAPRGRVTLDVVAYANPAGGNSTALDKLEDLVERLRFDLAVAELPYGDTDPPTFDPDSGWLSARTATNLRTTCN